MSNMDEATRKALEEHYRVLVKEAGRIRNLLDGAQSQSITPCDLRRASITGVSLPEIVQKAADALPAQG